MIESENEEEQFSDDPEEQLKIENEILKLKLNAELGGKFESLTDIPADIENLFLKNVIAFEHEHANADIKTVHDVLGNPDFVKSALLDEAALDVALVELEKLMEEKGIVVDYLVEYPLRLMYEFVTEELFQHESSMFSMPGMTTHYIYEEFHPNHEYDIRRYSEDFINHWSGQNFNEYSTEFGMKFILPGGSELDRSAVIQKFQWIFESYQEFQDLEYKIETVQFTLAENDSGTGWSEGYACYKALQEDGDTVFFEGNFRFEFLMSDTYWSIIYFTWPGFSW